MTDALVVFTPSGKRGRFPLGTPIIQAARALGVDIDSVCGGRGICGRCKVNVAEGVFAKLGIESGADHVEPLTDTELRYAKRKGLKGKARLSCQARLLDNIVIDVPRESQVHRQVVRKRADIRDIELAPVLKAYYIVVNEPDMHKARGDLERIQEALSAQWRLDNVTIDLKTLMAIQPKLRIGKWNITVIVHDDSRIISTRPGYFDDIYGIAVDIGSTTIAGHLCNLRTGEVIASAGMMNPQIRFGEDLMSRVSYVMLNPGGREDLTSVVRDTINDLVRELAEEAKIDANNIFEMVFVGNPVMHHLLLGIDPTELGVAPFALATDSSLDLWASDIDITATNDSARIYILPCIAGHVGADCAGVILSEGPHLRHEITLIVDVGTNAEIVLGNQSQLLACSSPTGPAFEGAQLTSGQRAAPGAVERVRIDPETLEPRFSVIGCDKWSDDPEFAGEVASTGVTGICGSGIIEAIGEMFLTGILDQDGVIDGGLAAKSDRIVQEGRTFSYLLHKGDPGVRITQNDVRAIQLAKGALYAGCKLLMDSFGVDYVDKIVLAGAFGSHIDPKYALIMGLVPDCEVENVIPAGNSAGTGARIALLNKDARLEIEQTVRTIKKIETAVEPKFQEHFVSAMALPNKTDPFEKLAKTVKLPAPKKSATTGDEEQKTRRRRRRSS